jgi:Ca2+-binding RTX toxin-like protein
MRGGAGGDAFYIERGDSGVTPGSLDQILDWDSTDSLDFRGLPTAMDGANYLEVSASSYDAALASANTYIAGGAFDYVAVQVGSDVVVFADNNNDDGTADDAVVLVGRTLDDLSATAIPAGTGGVTITGSEGVDVIRGSAEGDIINALGGADGVSGLDGDDTIDGGVGADVIDGGAGNDSIIAGDGADNVSGGLGADTIDGGIGADVIDGGAGTDSLTLLAGGADVVMVAAGQSAVTTAATSVAGADSISGWTAADHSIDFTGFLAGGVGNYDEGGAPVANYAAAFADANAAFDGVVSYYASEITGVGVVVFHDNDLDGAFENGEDALLLVGKGLADISFVDII